MPRKRIWSSKWQTKTKKKKAGDLQSGALDFKLLGVGPELGTFRSRVLTTRPRRLGANLRRDATSHVFFLNQSVLADFDDRKKKDSHFKTRSLSGTSNNQLMKVTLSCW